MQTVIHTRGQLYYRCPGCGGAHSIPVAIGEKKEREWKWDGDLEKPTVTPSVKHFYPESYYKEHPGLAQFCCHYFITKGVIEYCGDCTHEHSGKHVPLSTFSEAEVKMHAMEEKA